MLKILSTTDCAAMNSPTRRPGPDSTLDEVRAKLIDAGITLLRARGVDLGLSDITLSAAIAEAGVTRSTAYRSLADDDLAPQAVLHRELLAYLLTRYNRTDTRTTLEAAINAELDHHVDTLASGSAAERTSAMRSIIRIGANTSYQAVIDSPERSILTAIYGSLRSSPAPADWRHQAIIEGERGLASMFTELYSGLVALFAYRVKAPFTLNQFTAAAASLVEGLAMRHGFNDELTMIQRATGPGGEMQEWSLFAVSFEAMFMGMCEPNNPDEPFADLLRY